ncbi:MAG: ChaN family lipoprotein [Nitrospirae bacterium]|nr:ChaN family lipoprotein [Nitrospirota bacterium]
MIKSFLSSFVFIIVLFLFSDFAQAIQQSDIEIPENNLDVSVNISDSSITGVSQITLKKGHKLSINTGLLKILSIKINNLPIHPDLHGSDLELTPGEDGILEIKYEGFFKPAASRDSDTSNLVQSIIDKRGVSLTGLWYPAIDGLSRYRLRAVLPNGYEAVSEAEDIKKVVTDENAEFYFDFEHPADGINLIASDKYIVVKDDFEGVEISAYFFREDIDLAGTYIEYAKKYLKLYKGLIGEYPYKKFSIVENFLQTGYSMPTFTLLGNSVLRLPFITETSLGHEILHQWFGNLVYADYEKGNWAEGLTAYLSDHLYKEREGIGWEYRKNIMIDYESYVRPENDISLRGFTGGISRPSRAVGYGKGAMVFHMLRNMLGEEVFFKSLKDFIHENNFRRASWDDLKVSFEKYYDRSLDSFFKQWIEEKGMLSIELKDAQARYADGVYELSFTIKQEKPVYELDIPVTVYSDGIGRKSFFRLNEDEKSFKVFLSHEPDKIVLDEDYDIARSLSMDEKPSVIGALLGDKDLVVTLSESENSIYKTIIESFKDKGTVLKKANEIKDSEMSTSSVVILGTDNPLISRLYGKLEIADAGFSVTIKRNPLNSKKVIGIFSGKSESEVAAGFRKISHYGKYGSLTFENGTNTRKEVEKTDRGIIMELKEDPPAVDMSALGALSKVIDSVSDKKIIYVGELHDVFTHHAVQLDIIKGLYKKNKKLVIGMEMFQRPFQKTLDDYIAERIDEKEFLKRSEYFKRWSFDYNLYKPILDFSRVNKIPIVGLNMEREIVDKVSEKGMDSLTDEEKKAVPSEMDYSNEKYRERINRAFKIHKDWKEKKFYNFYQSQIIWDETMSQSIDAFLRKNPDYQFVVIAGQGHLEYGTGIPGRTYRRNKESYSIVLIDADIEKGIADHVVFPKEVEGMVSPKLMVFLKAEDGKPTVTGFPAESVSEDAGMKAEDVIISIDNTLVNNIEELKIQLFYKKKGETASVKVLRKIEEHNREMEFKVKL